jgi:predicted dehydrogenase
MSTPNHPQDNRASLSRRQFLGRSAAAAALAAAPLVLPARVWGADTAANEKLGIGFIGTGKQAFGTLINGFLRSRETRVLAVCDVDTTRRNEAQKRVDKHYGAAGCAAYVDFRELLARKDIDAVCIATPDHVHAVAILAALKAGKDVYCEKPLTHNIHEAVEVMRAVDHQKRVLQTGSMQRSMREFRVACELVRNGVIGKLDHVECSFGDPGVPCDLPEEAMEPGLDWDRWIGPAQARPYNAVLSPRGVHDHFPNWRLYREFGGGMVTDWGAHHVDIAQWGLGMDASGPVEVLPPAEKGAKRGATLVYANGVRVVHKDGFGVHFFGSEGEIQVNRHKYIFKRGAEEFAASPEGKDPGFAEGLKNAEELYLQNPKEKLYVSDNHIGDFLRSVRSRKKPITNEQIGSRSVICCHLMNLAYYHGKPFKWNPAANHFADGTGDKSWLTRDYRAGWEV